MINFKPLRPTNRGIHLTQLTNLGRNKHVHRLLPQALLRGLGGQRRTLRKSFKLAEAEAKAPASVPTREAKADLVKTPSAEASIDCITSAALAATSEPPFVDKHQPTDLPVGYLNHPRPTWAVISVSKAHHGLSMLFHFVYPAPRLPRILRR
ncbi:MAG: hypothetical protein ACTS4Y_01565 [Candidatus Hodgkinia cicadicola]